MELPDNRREKKRRNADMAILLKEVSMEMKERIGGGGGRRQGWLFDNKLHKCKEIFIETKYTKYD